MELRAVYGEDLHAIRRIDVYLTITTAYIYTYLYHAY